MHLFSMYSYIVFAYTFTLSCTIWAISIPLISPVARLPLRPVKGILVTGSWDQGMRMWDPRLAAGHNCVCSVPLPGKVYALSAGNDRLVVGTSGRHVIIYDIRRWGGEVA